MPILFFKGNSPIQEGIIKRYAPIFEWNTVLLAVQVIQILLAILFRQRLAVIVVQSWLVEGEVGIGMSTAGKSQKQK